jgi:hypothetical protein
VTLVFLSQGVTQYSLEPSIQGDPNPFTVVSGQEAVNISGGTVYDCS